MLKLIYAYKYLHCCKLPSTEVTNLVAFLAMFSLGLLNALRCS
jgi:hypothetical protein